MKHFTVDVIWWLPDAPDKSIPGTLTFDSNGLELVTQGSIGLLTKTISNDNDVSVSTEPEGRSVPIIHGRSRDHKDLTLFDCTGYDFLIADSTNTYRITTCVDGCHAITDNFTEVMCQFDWLDAWTQPPSISEYNGDTVTIQWARRELASAKVADYSIRLMTGVEGKAGDHAVHLDRWTAFFIEGPGLPIRSIVESLVRPLQDLLVFALARPVRLTRFSVRSEKMGPREDFASVAFDVLQPEPTVTPSLASILSYTSPCLLTFNDSPIPFNQLLPRWFDLRKELSSVFVQLLIPLYAPFIFTENRYSARFQSAEALARKRYGGSEVERLAHRERVESVIEVLRGAGIDSGEVARAERLLKRNDKPLAASITELVESTGAVGKKILSALPTFGKAVTGARTSVSHPGRHNNEGAHLYWHGEVLHWVVRARLLIELGFPQSEVEERVLGRTSFTYALEKIRPTET